MVFTSPLWPVCSVSDRNRMDVSGDRRSCAISTTRSSPPGSAIRSASGCAASGSIASRTRSIASSIRSMAAGARASAFAAQPQITSARSISSRRVPSRGEARRTSSVTKRGWCWSTASAMAARKAAGTSMSAGSTPASRTRWATRRAAAAMTSDETPASGSCGGVEYSSVLSAACGRRASPGRVVMTNLFLASGRTTGQPVGALLVISRLACQELALQPVALHQPIQRGPVESRDTGGARYVPTGLCHQLLQEATLEPTQQPLARGAIALRDRVVGVFHGGRAFVRVLRGHRSVDHRNRLRLDLRPRPGEHHHVLDHVLQLAHIALPGSRAELADAGLRQAGQGLALAV